MRSVRFPSAVLCLHAQPNLHQKAPKRVLSRLAIRRGADTRSFGSIPLFLSLSFARHILPSPLVYVRLGTALALGDFCEADDGCWVSVMAVGGGRRWGVGTGKQEKLPSFPRHVWGENRRRRLWVVRRGTFLDASSRWLTRNMVEEVRISGLLAGR